jgi:tetratricopeptide (TPR) repeat protein
MSEQREFLRHGSAHAPETIFTLIRGAAEGHAEDRPRFCGRYLPVVRAYLTARWCGTAWADQVDDAVQDVFLECLKERGALETFDRERAGGFRAVGLREVEGRFLFPLVLELRPDFPSTRCNLAACDFFGERWAAAAEGFRTTLAEGSCETDHVLHYAYAIREGGGDRQEAAKFIRELVEGQDCQEAKVGLAFEQVVTALRQLEQYADALALAERAVEIHPDDADAHAAQAGSGTGGGGGP